MAANVAAVVAATGGVLAASHLPAKFQRLFSPKIMEIIASLVIRLSNKGKAFVFDVSSTFKQISSAIVIGATTVDESVKHFHDMIDTIDPSDKNADFLMKKFLNNIEQCKLLNTKVTNYSSLEGAKLFILFKLSTVLCGSVKGSPTAALDFCAPVETDGDTTSHKSYSASLVRPTTVHQMYSLVHLWQLALDSFGLCPIRVLAPFLEEVLFDPIRSETLSWPVAFESVILYVKRVEASPLLFSLADVVHKAGGLDSIREEAKAIARAHYSADFFRSPGGSPGIVVDGKGIYKNGDAVSKCDMSAKKVCASWNNDAPHFTKNIRNGACIFRHACDQYVTDKGTGGQCHGAHKRKDCTYDTSKRCSKPLP